MPNKEAVTVAHGMIKVFSTYEFPTAVLSDNGSEFCNKVNFILLQ